MSAPNEKNNPTWSWNKAKANVDYLFIMATRRECPWRMMGPVFNVKACSLWVYGYTYALCVCLPCACFLFVYPCPTLATPRPAPRSCATHISAAHLVICSSAVWTRDTRQATRDTRDTQLSHLVSRVSHRTSNTLNIQLFSHLFRIYNCFLCSHTHRLKLAFGTWLVLCSVKYYRLECRVESFNWRKERKFLDGFQVLELGTPLVCCVF